MGFTRHGKRSQKTTERSTILNGKTHYFDWAMFNSFLYVYQRVRHATNWATTDQIPSFCEFSLTPVICARPHYSYRGIIPVMWIWRWHHQFHEVSNVFDAQCFPMPAAVPGGEKETLSGFGVDLQVVGLQVGMSSYKDDTKISSGVPQCVNMSCCSSSVDCIYTYIQHKSVYMNLYVYCNVLKNLRNRTWKTQQFVSFDNQSTSERVANPCSSETSAM